MPEQHDPMYAATMVAKSQLRLGRLMEGNAPPVLIEREEKLLADWREHLKHAVAVAADLPPRDSLLGALAAVGGVETTEDAQRIMAAVAFLDAAYPDGAAT